MPDTKRKPGRPRLYATDADRLRAWREAMRRQIDQYTETLRAWEHARRKQYAIEFEQALALTDATLAANQHPAASLFRKVLDDHQWWTMDAYCRLRLKQDDADRPQPPEAVRKHLNRRG